MIGADDRAPIAHPPVDWFAIAPEIALFGAAIVIVILRSVVRHDPRVPAASLLIAIAGVADVGACSPASSGASCTATARTRPIGGTGRASTVSRCSCSR